MFLLNKKFINYLLRFISVCLYISKFRKCTYKSITTYSLDKSRVQCKSFVQNKYLFAY